MDLKTKLEYHYKAFDRKTISPDPLQFLHLFSDRDNIEAVGFLASVFAYGNVKQIIASMNKIIEITEGNPVHYLKNFEGAEKILFRHRFYTEQDIEILFLLLGRIYKRYGSLEKVFIEYYESGDTNIRNALSRFSDRLLQEIMEITNGGNVSPGLRFMFPSPESGSSCKRANLFLRWMVRKDELDFGLWKGIRTNQLIIPVDTHIANISRELKLTKLKNISWKMAEEITDNLKKYDAEDPVKYDFALCHIGMRKMKL